MSGLYSCALELSSAATAAPGGGLRSPPFFRSKSVKDANIQTDIETRLAAAEPEVEVLLAERVSAGTVRVFIDRPGGVDLETCERVTRHLRDLLTETGLEVSSPGPERPLTKPDHFRRFIGRRARVRT